VNAIDPVASNTALTAFEFEATHRVRVDVVDGQPRFILADVCKILGIGTPAKAAGRLDAEDKGMSIVHTPGGPQEMTHVTESGVYALIFTSRKEEAKRFKRWVTSDVLPSIRRSGHYSVAGVPALDDPVALRALLLGSLDKTIALQGENEKLAPRAAALDRIAGAAGSLCATDTAKALKVRPKELFDFLAQHGWIYRRVGSGRWVGYQAKVAAGFLEHRIQIIQRQDGTDKPIEQVLITSRGLAKLSELLNATSDTPAAAGGGDGRR
jgi:anti-repressor protein